MRLTKNEGLCTVWLIRKFIFCVDPFFYQYVTTHIRWKITISSILGGHGGGDYGLMKAFVGAIASNNPALVLSGPKETLESHRMVFAAETARREGCVVYI